MVDFTSSIIAQVVVRQLRSLLNGAIGQFTPNDIRTAVLKDQSIWGGGEDTIRQYTAKIPGIESLGKAFVDDVEKEYGSVTNLVVMWLREDQKLKYGMIVNTPGGSEWLDRQVQDVLVGLGVKGNV
ncbi:MAG: hypothetical protein WC277_06190 [Bacilli bacterium]